MSKLRGYRFAASLILMQKPDAIKQLRSNIECSFYFGDYNDFDSGIQKALNDAVKLGIAEEEEDYF